MIKSFRYLAIAEGISFLLILGVTMPLKYAANMPEPNLYVGMAHGILFLAYLVMLFVVHADVKFKISELFWLGIASLLPFGTFIADRKILLPRQHSNA